MPASQATTPGQKSSDAVLWVAAAAVAGVAVTWLVLSKPWASGAVAPASRPLQTSGPAMPSGQTDAEVAGETAVDGWLRMARLALDSGMLLEPEGSNAWSLYARVRDQQPNSIAALQGLEAVADALIERGKVALEQGRLADAAGIIDVIVATLPEHGGASALAAALAAARVRTEEAAARAATLKAELQAASTAAPAGPLVMEVDPVAETRAAFDRAMAENRLLTPGADNAEHFAEQMLALAPQHASTREARRALFDALLARAAQASEGLDARAANTWLDRAESLDLDPLSVQSARRALADRLAAIESSRPVPASELAIARYVPPEYPPRAVTREVEGWVDVEFTVAPDGTTRAVTIAGASHDDLFRTEAVDAVAQWQFEPRVFMDRVIEQRAFTRIRFELE